MSLAVGTKQAMSANPGDASIMHSSGNGAKRRRVHEPYPEEEDKEEQVKVDENQAEDDNEDNCDEKLAMLSLHFEKTMLGILHEEKVGNLARPRKTSSGCAYGDKSKPDIACQPLHGVVVSGKLKLNDVPGAHLDYTILAEVGHLLPGEFADVRDGAYFTQFAYVMDIWETYVPAQHRGMGHAQRLARAAFAVAHVRGYLVRPSCTYISDTFLGAQPVDELRQPCEDVLLFSCCVDGRGLEPRRRALAALSAAQLKAECEQSVPRIEITGSKKAMIERLLVCEFGSAARQRETAIAGRRRCRER